MKFLFDQYKHCGSVVLFLFLCFPALNAQDFLFQGWYWDYPKTNQGANWANHLEDRATELADAGFTHVWLPPLSRASFGSGSNGYDPKDLFDLGEFGLGPTGFGTRSDVDALVNALRQNGIDAVADVVYNHRDGGAPENNPAVAGWIRNLDFNKVSAGDQPYPSDRFRLVLPLGGNTGLGAGTYFFKFGSRSGHPNFHNKPYKVYTETNVRGFQGQPNLWESEPNGGGGCGQPNNQMELGRDIFANVDAFGCTIDEFALTINPGDFDPAGDRLYIYVNNREVNGLGDYSDHTVLELFYTGGGGNLENRIVYETYTDFTGLPSGRGGMNYTNFKPNGNPTQLAGDRDGMFFFYDYDQQVTSTRDVLFDWTRWLWNDVDIRGYRMDAVKQFDPAFVGDLLDDLHDNGIDPGLVVGEFFDGNTGALAGWISEVYANMDEDTKQNIAPRLFDFSLRYALEAASDAFGYDARNVFNASMADAQGVSGFNVVTFTDNHDFREPGARIDNDPMLAYAYILTNNQLGLPTVFYDDYYGKGLKSRIDQLIGVHRDYIFGSSQRDYLSRFGTPYAQNFTAGFPSTTLLYQLSGGAAGRDVIVAINYAGESLDVEHGLNVSSLGLESGDELVELTGNGSDAVIAANGSARFTLPARSYGVWVVNAAPVADAGTDFTVACTSDAGTTVSLDGTASSDADGEDLSYAWSGPFGTVSGAESTVSLPVGVHAVTLTVMDGLGASATDEVIITVADNEAPTLSDVSGPADPLELGTSASISLSFTDDCGATHNGSIDWGDGVISAAVVSGDQVSGEHVYSAPGVYEVAVTIADDNGNGSVGYFRYVVVYDPAAGFVTGGGWIESPVGAYADDPTLTGRANFGFVSRYKKGQSTPSGNTQFKFRAADLEFRSTFYDWLVIAGSRAQFKGEGTINGAGNYGFMLTGRDGDLNGQVEEDRFRIKIWDKSEGDRLIYDNQVGADDNEAASDAIEGGSIVIHAGGKKRTLETGTPISAAETQLLVFPNPTKGATRISFYLADAGFVQLGLYDGAGRNVRQLYAGQLPGGPHNLRWDGAGDGGQALAPGAYFLRLRTEGGTSVQSVMLLQ